jgi:hypothetical protein
MSEYDDAEASATASAPTECYKFIGSFQTYRYTSADRAITLAGEVYLPVAVTRSRVKAGTHEDDNLSLELTIPFDTDVVMAYAYAQTPPKLTLEVYRQQNDITIGTTYSLFWKGLVRGFNVSGRTATVQVPSIFSLALQGEIPNVYYQTPCNHVLYDAHCAVSRAAHRFEDVIASVTGVTIELVGVPTTDNDLAAGEIVNLRNGERRMILSNVGSIITVGYAFVDLQPGDDIEVVRGCNHRGVNGDCKLKFNNLINYGGFEYIPADNPFTGEVA